MKEIDITLRAKNSSGIQTLSLIKAAGTYYFTLFGHYNGSGIQIDFDEMKREELEDLKTAIDLILEA